MGSTSVKSQRVLFAPLWIQMPGYVAAGLGVGLIVMSLLTRPTILSLAFAGTFLVSGLTFNLAARRRGWFRKKLCLPACDPRRHYACDDHAWARICSSG